MDRRTKQKLDSESNVVKEYDNEQELLEDLVSYRFTTLPVISNGVEIKDIEVSGFNKPTSQHLVAQTHPSKYLILS